jgi:hypothetical protein
MRRVTLFEPNGRRVDLTPRTRRQRIASALSITLALIVSLALWALVVWSLLPRPVAAQSNSDIANAIIRECAAIYHATGHPCACPEDRARNGSRCGKRSAYTRPGGASPRCYVSDVSAREITDYRAGRKDFARDCTPSR